MPETASVPDIEALRSAIAAIYPEHADARLTLLTAGWDSVAVDADDRVIFKFPRHEAGRRRLAIEAGLLAVIRPAVTMTVPDLQLHDGPPLFSRHSKIAGDHIVTAQYEALTEPRRQAMAEQLALFYAQIHALPRHAMEKAGARPIEPWLGAEDILKGTALGLPEHLKPYVERTARAWVDLPPDPYGMTYGFFDGHGWNMAFDHERGRLNGLYDFADSGLGSLHQDFVYSNWISRDLTARIVGEYEALTGRSLDRERIELLSGVLRLHELAEIGADDQDRHWVLANVESWAGA